jgi:3',5'-cyclic AMP phosphodiesterase CpdA
MKLTAVMVATYIADCCLIGTKPCKYFQFNSPFFNKEKGIFSKIDLDLLFPDEWRLPQRLDDGKFVPEKFPVFVKPEWGENASGIFRADSIAQLADIRSKTMQSGEPYLVQQGASEAREFEIFSLRHPLDPDKYSVYSITEVSNQRELNPVNSIHNPDTEYLDITDQLSEAQKKQLWELLGRVGRFGISRLCVRADSIEDIVDGRFHIIELNLYTPMPIHMLDRKYSNWDRWRMVRAYMMLLARVTKTRDTTLPEKPVYTSSMRYSRHSRKAGAAAIAGSGAGLRTGERA